MSGFPPTLPPDFIRLLRTLGPCGTPWFDSPDFNISKTSFSDIAEQAYEMVNGVNIFKTPQVLNLGCPTDIRFLDESRCHQGCRFFAFVFSEPGSFDVVVWIEDDLYRSRTVWRGDTDAFVKAALILKMLGATALDHLI